MYVPPRLRAPCHHPTRRACNFIVGPADPTSRYAKWHTWPVSTRPDLQFPVAVSTNLANRGQGTVVAVVVSLVSLESLVGRHEIEACALLACSTSFGIFILSDRFAAEGDGDRFSSSAVEFRFLGLVPLECGNGMGII